MADKDKEEKRNNIIIKRIKISKNGKIEKDAGNGP